MSRILEELHAHLHANQNVLLHYDAVIRCLVPYCWPLDEQGRPVDPSQLEDYRSSHTFSYPGCLCAAIFNSTKQTESILFDVFSGEGHSGKEYIASCSKGLCGYAVKVFFRPEHPVSQFPRKVQPQNQHAPENLAPRALRILADIASQQDVASRAPIKEKTEYTRLLEAIPLFPPPPTAPNLPSLGSMIYRMHSAHRPGLIYEEFCNAFVSCECGIVSTRRKHEHHRCGNVERSVIGKEGVPTTSDTEVLNLLYRLDMTGPELTLEVFKQIMARCPCGLVMTKLRFQVHECHRQHQSSVI